MDSVEANRTCGQLLRHGWARLASTAALAIGLSGCQAVLLHPQGPIAAGEATIVFNSLGMMSLIVVPTILATLGFAWWYRAGNGRARFRPDWAYSGRVEAVTWGIPILMIVFLGGLAWAGAHDLDPSKPIASKTKSLNIQVVSLDWKWLFIYPEQGVASVNRLVIPAGTPIHLSLTSSSVMNTFYVPQLAGMIYTMNGMSDQLNLKADHAGTYFGESGMFSGDGFPGMHFNVDALPPQQFAAWASSVHGHGPSLDGAAYTELAKQSSDVKPYNYGTTEPDLYTAIVAQKLAPGPGPQFDRPSPEVIPHQEH